MDAINSTITNDLPEFYVANRNGDPIDDNKFIKMPDGDDYSDALNMCKDLEIKKGTLQLTKKVEFNLIDTLGLNATASDDESHVHKIFCGLNRVTTIHLLLITNSSGPFTQGLQDAIKTYANLLPCFNGTIAIEFPSHARPKMSGADFKAECLHKIMGRTTLPHFKIDCNTNNKQSIRECITQNMIQRILDLARTCIHPVDVVQTVINKTCKIRDIDSILRDRFETTLIPIGKKDCLVQKSGNGELIIEILCNEAEIHQPDARAKFKSTTLPQHSVLQVRIPTTPTTNLKMSQRDIKQEREEYNEAKKQQTREILESIQILELMRDDYLAPEVLMNSFMLG
ncbi:hypothetical protein BG000_001839 [Podila horticola]|nr:hypothetical protein BG000_001839 [Podila horticola]